MRTPCKSRRSRWPRPLHLEPLGDRSVPAAYTLTDLGVVATGNGYDINEAGQVVGTLVNATGQSRAFLWDDGVLTDLGTLGGDSASARGLNDAGQVVGVSRVAPGSTATDVFIWDVGVMTGIGVGGATPAAINDAGQVVGSYTVVHSFHGQQQHGFLWDNGAFHDLFSPGAATDINDAGQVSAQWESTRHYPVATVWGPQTGTQELGTLPGGVLSGAYALNDVGQVVGWSDASDGMPHPALWDNGQAIDLGVLSPDPNSFAADVNNAGQVVGSAGGPFLWDDGVMANLNDLVVNPSGLTLDYGWAINDAGQIVAVGRNAQGVQRVVLLDPMPGDTPLINIGDATVTEGHAGTQTAVFTVTLSTASGEPVTVAFATANGSAAGSDYQAASGTLTFAPGETTKTVSVPVNGDRAAEPNETFVVNLSGATGGAVLLDAQGVGTIVDDEPRITIGDVSKAEGNGGTTLFVFTVTLSAPSDVAVTVNFATANGTATAGDDYDTRSGTLTFAPGETSKTITIAVRGDKKRESGETFFVNLSGAGGALILDAQGLGTIMDDDRR